MKKLLVVAIAVCMVFGVVGMASATDMKVSGNFWVRGIYWDTTELRQDQTTSQGFWWHKWRIAFTLEPVEGVGVYARADFEDADGHVWGTNAGAQNFNSDYQYGWFKTAVGQFTIGRMSGGTWALTWADQWRRADRVKYTGVFGNLTALVIYEKRTEADWLTVETDADGDDYYAAGMYKGDWGQAGLLLGYLRRAGASALGQKTTLWIAEPYAKLSFGPLYIEAELDYVTGSTEMEGPLVGVADVDRTGLSYYVNAKYSFGPAYVGGFFSYVEGDDPNTPNDNEAGLTGNDYELGLILFSDEDWATNMNAPIAIGNTFGANGTNDGAMGYGIYAGMAVMEGMTVKAALVTGSADEVTGSANDDDFGREFDLELSYKINEAVTYAAGFGYLWTGDYWKGTTTADLEDTYLLQHSLTWTF